MDPYAADSELPGAAATDKFLNPVAYKSLRSQSSATARPIHSMKSMYCSLSICSILLALIGLSYLLFDPIVKYVVLNRLVLKNESEFGDLWQNPPITPHLKVYFFNLTNPEEFFSGSQVPHLEEVGPFTYHQTWIKENVRWHNNGTMSYSTRKEFKFVPELSIADQSKTNLTLINVPYISALHQMRKLNSWTAWMVDQIFTGMDMKTWTSKSPEQFIWGYPDQILELAANYLPDPPGLKSFGFFTEKNKTQNLASYTMYTGESNPYNLSKISLFNGKDSLGIWPEPKSGGGNSDTCNKIQGSDGATFNPYINEDETLWFFNDQLCRSLPLVFDQKVKSGGLPGLRFVPRSDVFKLDFEKYPQNACFCQDEDLCSVIGDGMFAVPKCQFNAPIVLSWPHFLHANQTFVSRLKGLTPGDPKKHGFWFDIQPTTGTTLSAKARVQINIAVRNNPSFTFVDKINDTIVPLLWFEEGLDELGDELIEVIGQAVTQPPVYKGYIFCILLGVALTTFSVMCVTAVCYIRNMTIAKRSGTDQPQILHPDHLKAASSILKSNKTPLSNFKKGHNTNPSQGSGKFLLESLEDELSRHHSRNSSTGSTPPTFVDNTGLTTLNHETPEEAERLLSPRQN